MEKLYPSLQTLEAARITRLAIMESNIDITGVDLLRALRYIYIVGDNELIEYIQKTWTDIGLDRVELTEYDFYLSWPNQVLKEFFS